MMTHGGARPGAGRKPGKKPSTRSAGLYVRLTDEELGKAKALGAGNASAGVRAALAAAPSAG